MCVLVGLGESMMQGSVVACTANISLCFIFQVFSELDDIQLTVGCLFSSFLNNLGSLFLIFDVRSRPGNQRFSGGALEEPRLR